MRGHNHGTHKKMSNVNEGVKVEKQSAECRTGQQVEFFLKFSHPLFLITLHVRKKKHIQINHNQSIKLKYVHVTTINKTTNNYFFLRKQIYL